MVAHPQYGSNGSAADARMFKMRGNRSGEAGQPAFEANRMNPEGCGIWTQGWVNSLQVIVRKRLAGIFALDFKAGAMVQLLRLRPRVSMGESISG
jgi:hypothetical protein